MPGTPEPAIAEALPRVRELATAALRRYGIPGASAGIVAGGRLVWSEGFGVADLVSGTPAGADTLYRVASITKTFTGAAIMQLRDAGRLSLDDPLVKHVPEFRKARARRGSLDQVTIRRLLTHHSGLVSEAPFPYWDTLDFPPFERMLKAIGRVEVVLDPDAHFKYSNLAFALLGEVIARAGGTPYETRIRDQILRPLRMTSSGFELTSGMRRRLATGYDINPYADRPNVANHHPIGGLMAAGGLYSSVQDLAKWVAFHLDAYGGGDNKVLSPATRKEMHRPQILEPDWRAGYGLPWRSTRSGDRIYANHGGGLPGHRTTVHFDAAHGLGFIFLTNLGWHNAPEEVAVPALDALNEAQVHAAPMAASRNDPVPEGYERLLGMYVGRDVLFAGVEWRDGELQLVLPPGVRSLHAPTLLRPTDDPLAFEVVGGRGAGELARFDLDSDGDATAFALGGAVYRRLRRLG